MLKIIKDRPTHGYDIIKQIELRSDGRWTPSAGSIYPILEGLEKNGIIWSEDIDRKKVYAITPKGEIAFERMTEKKQQLLEEMTRVIEYATESGDAGSLAGHLTARQAKAGRDGGAAQPGKNVKGR